MAGAAPVDGALPKAMVSVVSLPTMLGVTVSAPAAPSVADVNVRVAIGPVVAAAVTPRLALWIKAASPERVMLLAPV